jgi:hypothetical protein
VQVEALEDLDHGEPCACCMGDIILIYPCMHGVHVKVRADPKDISWKEESAEQTDACRFIIIV